jgi:hypothetical protein
MLGTYLVASQVVFRSIELVNFSVTLLQSCHYYTMQLHKGTEHILWEEQVLLLALYENVSITQVKYSDTETNISTTMYWADRIYYNVYSVSTPTTDHSIF